MFINEKYRQHYKIAIEYLLNRINPYTKTALKDDPLLAIVEPLNEQDLRIYIKKNMEVLKPAFVTFLKEKYKTIEQLAATGNEPELKSFDAISDITDDALRAGDSRSSDMGNFLIKTMQEMTGWYYRTIKDAGYPGLMSQWDMIMRTIEIPVRAQLLALADRTYAQDTFKTARQKISSESAPSASLNRH